MQAMKEIARFYKQKIPTLKRMKVKSDGQVHTQLVWMCLLLPRELQHQPQSCALFCQRSQYKGRKNFGPMASWPHPEDLPVNTPCCCMENSKSCGRDMLPGLGIEMYHDFPPSHHGSGPVDSYGKDARKGMDRDTKFNKLHRYNFEHCYKWSVEHLSQPVSREDRFGKTWSATGYEWRAYTDGSHETEEDYQQIPADKNWQSLQGSNEFYAFRAVSTYRPEIRAQFVPCYCGIVPCPHRHITMAHSPDNEEEYFDVHQIPGAPTRADSDDDV